MDNGNARLKEDDKEVTKGSSQNSLADGEGGHYSTNASCSTVHSHLTAASDKDKADEAINQWLKGVKDADPMKPLLDSFSSQETDIDSEPILEICQNMSELEPEEEPEFVVTLHGLDPGMFPKMNENVDDDIDSDGENLEEECPEDNVNNGLVSGSEEVNQNKVSPPLSPKEASEKKLKRNTSPIIIVKQSSTQGNADTNDGVKMKSLERCKYWPSCLLGDKCSFHHPSTQCNAFPACKYGDSCLFIHPACKFGISCTRRDCSYAHSSPVIAGIPKVKMNPLVGALQYCRFYPNCTNVNCQFYHPKPCRFGRYCAKKDCPFEHKKGPSKDKLKWTRVQTMM